MSYYISTGSQQNFFTLRQTWQERVYTIDQYSGNGACTGAITRDFHVRNLSTDREQAIAKAKEITGADLSTDIEVIPIGTPRQIDWSILQAGKHSGRSIHELAENAEGRQYLIWLAENCAGNGRYAKSVDLARAVLAHELEARKAVRDAAATLAERRGARARRVLAPIHEALVENGGSWSLEAARGLGKSRITERFADILADIFGRQFGRRNSKAYASAYAHGARRLSIAARLLNNQAA